MEECTGYIVRSEAGHDKGTLLCVVGTAEGYLLLADGKTRKARSPKRKKPGHVAVVNEGTFGHPVLERLRRRESVSDRALRQVLGAFRAQQTGDIGQGGNHAWQKTI